MIPSPEAISPEAPHRRIVDDYLPAALLFLFLGIFLSSWIDWHIRMKRLGHLVDPAWDCPACGVVNEAERSVCWSCSAAIGGRNPFARESTLAVDTWRCGRCGAWNGTGRPSCWSCAHAPTKQPKRHA